MIIYEVNLDVDKEIAKDFETWLKPHMQEVVSCGHFEKALSYQVEDPIKILWTIHYHAKNRSLVETYLEEHAPRLREEGLKKFGKKFRATRRILKQL